MRHDAGIQDSAVSASTVKAMWRDTSVQSLNRKGQAMIVSVAAAVHLENKVMSTKGLQAVLT